MKFNRNLYLSFLVVALCALSGFASKQPPPPNAKTLAALEEDPDVPPGNLPINQDIYLLGVLGIGLGFYRFKQIQNKKA